ncbi:MAG: hypothetical protein CMN78_06360 [Spirochaetales bacterium]|nr:hypothetical protein [Spirochaetales bacterium]
MILPNNRYQFSSRRSNPGRNRLLISVIAATVIIATFIFWQRSKISELFARETSPEITLDELWGEKRYAEINAQCEVNLIDEPLQLQSLIYNGLAYFYRGVNQFSLEEKIALIDKSIANLRKARILDPVDMSARIFYVLGKAYYYKGKYYADLTIEYLTGAIANGYVGDDTYEYLGLAYSNIGDYAASAGSFSKAVEQNPTDMRNLALSQAYFNAGEIEQAELHLISTIKDTVDPTIGQKSRFLLGKVYFETDQLEKAEEQYRHILSVNPQSADAYFFLGEIYQKYDKNIEARAEWRKALQIDPSHYGARLRVYR